MLGMPGHLVMSMTCAWGARFALAVRHLEDHIESRILVQ